MEPTKVITRAEVIRGMEDMPRIVRHIRIRQTAKMRHESRVLATLEAVANEVAPDSDRYRSLRHVLLSARNSRCAWECVEGQQVKDDVVLAHTLLRLDLESGISLRMPWARGLGKGRWKAADGEAYRAAAEEARRAAWRAVGWACGGEESLAAYETAKIRPAIVTSGRVAGESLSWVVRGALKELSGITERLATNAADMHSQHSSEYDWKEAAYIAADLERMDELIATLQECVSRASHRQLCEEPWRWVAEALRDEGAVA